MSHRQNYRPDIDGLRAVAVLSVIAYHFDIAALPGGFAGVDVFFVISGYLITTTIWTEIRTGTFSCFDFYVRRALRILPALTVMILVVLIAGYFILWPSDYAMLGLNAAFALAGVSNFYFFTTSDYFAPSSELLPLLHTWSLGVEEQFYLLWPFVLLVAANRPNHKLALRLTLAVIAVSLVIGISLSDNPPAAFFLPWARMWELAIGASLVFLPSMTGRIPQNGLGLSGLLLLIGAFSLTAENRPFPGSPILMSSIGAALLIASGRFEGGTVAARMLRLPGIPAVGQISYSLYLWHWPILVFYKHHTANSTPGALALAGLFIATLAVSVFSRTFIEKPFLVRVAGIGRWRVRSAILATGTLIGISIAIHMQGGFAFRVHEQVARILSYQGYDLTNMFRKGTCFMDFDQDVRDIDFEKCLPQTDHTAVLWGSSVSAHLYFGLEKLFADRGYALGQLTGSACRPVPNIDMPARPNCRDFNNAVLAKLLQQRPQWVIIGGFALPQTPDEAAEAAHAINALTDAGIAVDVLGYPPVFSVPVPQLLAARLNAKNGSALSTVSEQYDPKVWEKDPALAHWIAEHTSARYIRLLDLLCHDQECALLTPAGVPIYVDHAHMSREGSAWLGHLLAARLFNSSGLPATLQVRN